MDDPEKKGYLAKIREKRGIWRKSGGKRGISPIYFPGILQKRTFARSCFRYLYEEKGNFVSVIVFGNWLRLYNPIRDVP